VKDDFQEEPTIERFGMKSRLALAAILSLCGHAVLLGIGGGAGSRPVGKPRAIGVEVVSLPFPGEGDPAGVRAGAGRMNPDKFSINVSTGKHPKPASSTPSTVPERIPRAESLAARSPLPSPGTARENRKERAILSPAQTELLVSEKTDPVLKDSREETGSLAPMVRVRTAPGENVSLGATPGGASGEGEGPGGGSGRPVGRAEGRRESLQPGGASAVSILPGIPGDNLPPEYPRIARRRGWQGTVLLRVKVAENGRVREAWVERSSGFRILDDAALAAARKWRMVVEGKGAGPKGTDFRIPVTFKLTEG
jgi:protein TonB